MKKNLSSRLQLADMKKNRRRAGMIFLLLFVLLLAGYIWMREQLAPVTVTISQKRVFFQVKQGESLSQVALQLEKLHLIRNASALLWYVRLFQRDMNIQAGQYALAPSMGSLRILTLLEQGQITLQVVKVTFPEGFTARQMAERLQEDGICSAKAFMQAANSSQYSEWFVRYIPNNPEVHTHLEGYLYPNTYDFYKGEPAHQIVNELLQEFGRVVTPAMYQEIIKEGQTLPAIITEASLIEKEAYLESDKPLIASVIDNRLKRGMPLQIDATLEYVLGYRQQLTVTDENAPSPYNTYLHKGLPPGPIANPGIESIEAAIHPAHTNYYYYVAKFNGTGGSYFASTYAQQLANEKKSQENYQKYMEHHQ